MVSSLLQEVPTNLEGSDFGSRLLVPVFGALTSDVLASLTNTKPPTKRNAFASLSRSQNQPSHSASPSSRTVPITAPNPVPHAPTAHELSGNNNAVGETQGQGEREETEEEIDAFVPDDGPGRVLVYGDSNCLDMNHRSVVLRVFLSRSFSFYLLSLVVSRCLSLSLRCCLSCVSLCISVWRTHSVRPKLSLASLCCLHSFILPGRRRPASGCWPRCSSSPLAAKWIPACTRPRCE